MEYTNECPVPVTVDRYIRCLERLWHSALRPAKSNSRKYVVPAARSNTSHLTCKKKTVWSEKQSTGEKIIRRRTPIPLPARLLDLTFIILAWVSEGKSLLEESGENHTVNRATTREVRRISPETRGRVTDEVKRCPLICEREKKVGTLKTSCEI